LTVLIEGKGVNEVLITADGLHPARMFATVLEHDADAFRIVNNCAIPRKRCEMCRA